MEASLNARAPGLSAVTPTVRQLAVRVGERVGLGADALSLLDLSVQVRDIGMLGLPDDVILATAPLSPSAWALVNRHPVLGAELLEQLAPVAPAAEIVRSHHERWDGEGYPDGRRGSQIPLSSRVIAACDAFAAMASDRPHRRGVGSEAALEQVCHERGAQFDPRVVDALVAALAGSEVRTGSGQARSRRGHPAPADRTVSKAGKGRRDLTGAIAEFDVIPALAPACDRILAATVSAIESDTGLTVAVLRRAQATTGKRPIANVPDAVAALSLTEIHDVITPLPRGAFPWRTTELEVLMHQSRVHAQAVTRAAGRIAKNLELGDDLVVAALLHDIGKLVLGRADDRYSSVADARTTDPEQRVRQERRAYGLDHASLGGLLISRWRLPKRLESAVASHHTAEAGDDLGTYVRLADMVAHHVQGDAVDRRTMLRLANTCGLTVATLRDVLFDLPRSGGSDRRRAEPNPLSSRQTEVLRLLAQGKLYKEIGTELGVSASTIRTHLHSTYRKLGVADRAQAVLKATEMAWI